MIFGKLMIMKGTPNLCSYTVMKYYKTLMRNFSKTCSLTCQTRCFYSYCGTPGQNGDHAPAWKSSCTDLALGFRAYSSRKKEASSSAEASPTDPNRSESSSVISSTNFVPEQSTKSLYKDIVEAFPSGIQMALAYGSGAIQQGGTSDMSKNMLDFIFVVDRPYKWHKENLQKHPHHYSFLKHLGPRTVTRIQERYAAGVYFNTLVPMEGRIIKYGVISTARLIADLLDWESLYIAGRLHKPISLVVLPTDENLITALRVNLKSAVHTSLLLLPDMFSEEQFYTCITSLSYGGDLRMGIAEDNQKVSNIVKPSLALFRRMYGPFLLQSPHVAWWPKEGQIEQALTFHSRHHHLKRLPAQVLDCLIMQHYKVGVFPDLEEIIMLQAHEVECAARVAQCLRHIVRRSSTGQTAKGVLTAGLNKSVRYSFSKVLKRLKSK